MVGAKVLFLLVAVVYVKSQDDKWAQLIQTVSNTWSQSHTGGDCNHEDRKDHAINLLKEWVKHHHYDAVARLYHDIYHKNLEGGTRKRQLHHHRYSSDFDEAFTNGNKDPDYRHVEGYIWYYINDACRREIMQWIELLARTHNPQAATTHAPVVTKTTHANTHAHVKTTVKAAPTTAAATKAPSTEGTTAPQPLVVNAKCDPVTFVTALARGTQLTNQDAGLCTDGTNSQPEALVLESCNAPDTSSWTKGVKVIGNCERIPDYSPIGTFTFGQYELNGLHMSGIITDCTPTGFKMALQLCGHPVDVIELKSGAADPKENADNYYVIEW